MSVCVWLPIVYHSQGKGQVRCFLASSGWEPWATERRPRPCLCLIRNSLSPLYTYKNPTPLGYNLKAGLELRMKMGSIFKKNSFDVFKGMESFLSSLENHLAVCWRLGKVPSAREAN